MKLVLLPGADGTGQLFTPLLDHLEHTPIVATYPTDRFLDYAQLEGEVRRLLPDEPCVVVAESFSVPLGLRLGAKPPPGMRGLVTVSPPPYWPWLAPLIRGWLVRLAPQPAPARRVHPEVMAARLRMVLRDRPPVPIVPHLQLRGRSDPTVRRGNVRGGHFLLQTRPAECARRIEEFVVSLR